LLKLILKFRIGKFAVTGDLQQFYNASEALPHELQALSGGANLLPVEGFNLYWQERDG
jgi:hypothetical protein